MKETTISVPTGTFPADVGDKVRVSLKKLNGFEMIDAYVMALVTGCGVSDRVTLRYDETLLPYGASQITACMVTGFQKQCECCSARMCHEVFGPDESVEVSSRHVLTLPGDFRLDQIKYYSPDMADVPLSLQVSVGGLDLFPHDLEMGEQALTVNRAAFSADFDTGLIASGTTIEAVVVDGPQGMHYETPWRGLTLCLIGIWYPHAKTAKGALRRMAGVRPPPDPDGSGYPGATLVDVGDGTLVTDGDGNFVSES
jgi:hypothetical protein